MFHDATAFNQPIGAWNTGAITGMSLMFTGAIAFNQPIGSWNTSAVRTMQQVFEGATAFNQPIGTWNTSLVNTMYQLFYNASSFNQNISGWIVSQVDSYFNFRAGSLLSDANTPSRFRVNQQNVAGGDQSDTTLLSSGDLIDLVFENVFLCICKANATFKYIQNYLYIFV